VCRPCRFIFDFFSPFRCAQHRAKKLDLTVPFAAFQHRNRRCCFALDWFHQVLELFARVGAIELFTLFDTPAAWDGKTDIHPTHLHSSSQVLWLRLGYH
jgi:hypothetical protein